MEVVQTGRAMPASMRRPAATRGCRLAGRAAGDPAGPERPAAQPGGLPAPPGPAPSG